MFLGVLIALGADSWWNQRTDRARAEQYLVTLEGDMTSGLEALTWAIESGEEHVAEIDSFLSLLRSDSPVSAESEQMLVRNVHATVPTGTIDALLATGDINLLESPELRAVIIEERAWIADINSDMSDVGQMLRDAQLGRLAASEQVRAAEKLGAGPLPIWAMRRSPSLISGYAAHRTVIRNQMRSMDALRVSTDRIRQAILESRD